jgi:hypothetical protein
MTAAMRSSQTAVLTFRPAVVLPAQSGLTYQFAPANGLSRCVPVGGGVEVRVGVRVGPPVGVRVGVRVGVFVGPPVGVRVGVRVGVFVGLVPVGVRVGVRVGVLVGRLPVGVRVSVGVLVGEVPPLHATPFRAKLVGLAFVPL